MTLLLLPLSSDK